MLSWGCLKSCGERQHTLFVPAVSSARHYVWKGTTATSTLSWFKAWFMNTLQSSPKNANVLLTDSYKLCSLSKQFCWHSMWRELKCRQVKENSCWTDPELCGGDCTQLGRCMLYFVWPNSQCETHNLGFCCQNDSELCGGHCKGKHTGLLCLVWLGLIYSRSHTTRANNKVQPRKALVEMILNCAGETPRRHTQVFVVFCLA